MTLSHMSHWSTLGCGTSGLDELGVVQMPRGTTIAIASVAVVLVAGAAGGGACYCCTPGAPPQETAQRFTAGLAEGRPGRACAPSSARPPPRSTDVREHAQGSRRSRAPSYARRGPPRPVTARGRPPTPPPLKLKDIGEWSYSGTIDLGSSTATGGSTGPPRRVHPVSDRRHRLRAEDQVAGAGRDHRRRGRPHRRRRRGRLGAAARRLPGQGHGQGRRELGTAYKAGDAIGAAGCRQTFQKRLAGTPTTEIQLVGADKKTVKTLDKIEGAAGEALETTLDLRVQKAAAAAVRDLKKTASLVAIRPSSGEILAVVNNQGGFNRALDGNYPPGSTFKAVTAIGLLAEGITPASGSPAPRTSRSAACRSATPTTSRSARCRSPTPSPTPATPPSPRWPRSSWAPTSC